MKRTSHGSDFRLHINPQLHRTTYILVVAALVMLTGAVASLAQSTTWTGLQSSSWNNPLNWTSGVPQDGWFVNMSGNEPSTMDIPGLDLAELYMIGYNSDLDFQQDLTVSGVMLVEGTVLLGNAALTVTGDLILSSGFFDTGTGWVDVGGMLLVHGVMSGNGAVTADFAIGGTGTISGALDITHTGGTVDFAAMLIIMTGTLDLTDASLSTGTNPHLGNVTTAGSCDFNGIPGITIQGDLDVRGGTLDVANSGLVVFGVTTISGGGALDNGGASLGYQFFGGVDLHSGTLRFTGGWIRIGSGQTLFVDAGSTLEILGSPPGTSITLFGQGTANPQWILDFELGSTVDIQYCLINDGNCLPGIRVTDCTNGGHNTGFIFAGEPDLWISAVSAPSIWTDANAPIPVSYTVRNEGDTVLTAFQAAMRVTFDTLSAPTGAPIQTLTVPGLDPFEEYSSFFNVVLPPGTPRGDVYIAATADDFDDIAEGDETNNTSFRALSYPVPEMYAVRDIPGDQGGDVYVSWYAAPPDLPAGGGLITQYTVWRAIDPLGVQAMLDEGATLVRHGEPIPRTASDVIRVQEAAGQVFFWHPIDTTGAYHLGAYGYPEPTLFDSTGTGFEQTYFQVIAHTADELVFYTSAPDSGYSVDNLAPAAPQNLAGDQVSGAGGLLLTWDPNLEMDLSHYAIYRGASAGFIPGQGNLLSESPDTFQTDGAWQWDSGDYYKVGAVDIHGNESVFAVLGPELATGIDPARAPAVNFLSQNYPNPFSHRTGIPFGLASEENVTIRIYDVRGRLVRTLVDGQRKAAAQTITWDGRDTRGTRVAAGIYFYRLEAGAFVQTKKMVVVR